MVGLTDTRAFFAALRTGILGPKLDDGEVEGCEAITHAFEGQPLSHCTYALGTAYLETAGTMRPIMEYGGPKYFFRMYDIGGDRPAKARELGNVHPGDGALFCGRGYPQVTGRKNYERAAAAFNIRFDTHPELMMVPDHAAKVMALFMEKGWFTGKKLADYLPASGPATFGEFVPARRIINGNDRAADVARFAVQFQAALLVGGWA